MTKRIQIAEVNIPKGAQVLEDTVAEFSPLEEVLDESADGEKKSKLRGRFGLAGVPTANKRLYSRKIMEREILKLAPYMENGQLFGELDHPGDGKTKLARVSHMITNLKVESNGEITGELVIVPGTTGGDQALAIARAGGKLGISSRGFGSTVPDTKGNYVVQEDYTLVSFDIVADPANAGAYPAYVVESKENPDMEKDLKTLRQENPGLVEELEAEISEKARDHARVSLREEFEAKLEEASSDLYENALEEATKRLLSDPEVAGSKTAMEAIAKIVRPFILREDEESEVRNLEARLEEAEKRLKESDEKRIVAENEAEEYGKLAQEAFYHLFLERKLGGDERREQVEGILGDVLVFESLESLSDRVDEIMTALSEEDKKTEISNRKIAQLEAKTKILQKRLNESMKVGNGLAIQALVEQRISDHPQREKLRSFINEHAPETKGEVDSIIESFEEHFPVSEEYERIRKELSLNEDSDDDDFETVTGGLSEGRNVLGVDMGLLAEMSGIPKQKK